MVSRDMGDLSAGAPRVERALHVVQGSVVDHASNSGTTFNTNLANTNNDFYKDMEIVFVSGDNAGQVRRISAYVGATGFITVDKTFLGEPAEGNIFYVIPRIASTDESAANQVWDEAQADHVAAGSMGKQISDIEGYVDTMEADLTAEIDANETKIDTIDGYHDVPSVDSTINARMRDVIGNKQDAGVTTASNTYGLIRYVKGLLTLHTRATADSTDNAKIKDVIGAKSDTAASAINDTSSLMRYAKMLVTDWLNGGRLDNILDGRAPSGEYDTELDANMSTRAPANEYDTQLDANMSTRAPASEYDTEMARITANVALASVLGALTDAAAQDGDATTSTVQSLLKGLHDVLWDADGLASWEAAAAPGANVSMAAVLRSTYDDTNELQTDLEDGGRLDLLIDDIRGAVLLQTFNEPFVFNPQSQSVTQDTEADLDEPGTKTVTFPTNATLKKATLFAGIKANNQTIAEHNIGLTLQYNYSAGGWTDVSTMDELLTNPHLTLPATGATGDKVNVSVDVTSVIAASGNTITFRWQVDSDDDGEVHYLSTFLLVATYDFSGV